MTLKRPAKDERERLILLGLVELFLETGKPVGSSTLREKGFPNLSSATIRNYFSKLEKAGFLKQQHSSGGRVPTEQAFKLYAETYLQSPKLKENEAEELQKGLSTPSREVATYLQKAAELLAETTQCAVLLSSPRFDQDFVLDIKLVEIDPERFLCILLTDFGMVHTEMLFAKERGSEVDTQGIQEYLQSRISGTEKPKLSPEDEKLASQFYKEIMLRHIVSYSNFSAEDVYKTGLSKLLEYPDFNNATALANGLSLFENEKDLRALLKKGCENEGLSCLFSEDLEIISTPLSGCTLILIPYKIHQTVAGAIGILGPNRLPYRRLFGLLNVAAETISETLTQSLYKFKITFRQASNSEIALENKNNTFVQQASLLTEQKDEHE